MEPRGGLDLKPLLKTTGILVEANEEEPCSSVIQGKKAEQGFCRDKPEKEIVKKSLPGLTVNSGLNRNVCVCQAALAQDKLGC